MFTSVQIYNNTARILYEIVCFIKNGNPWFKAVDICYFLQFKQSGSAVQRHILAENKLSLGELATNVTLPFHYRRNTTFINMAGVSQLMRARQTKRTSDCDDLRNGLKQCAKNFQTQLDPGSDCLPSTTAQEPCRRGHVVMRITPPESRKNPENTLIPELSDCLPSTTAQEPCRRGHGIGQTQETIVTDNLVMRITPPESRKNPENALIPELRREVHEKCGQIQSAILQKLENIETNIERLMKAESGEPFFELFYLGFDKIIGMNIFKAIDVRRRCIRSSLLPQMDGCVFAVKNLPYITGIQYVSESARQFGPDYVCNIGNNGIITTNLGVVKFLSALEKLL